MKQYNFAKYGDIRLKKGHKSIYFRVITMVLIFTNVSFVMIRLSLGEAIKNINSEKNQAHNIKKIENNKKAIKIIDFLYAGQLDFNPSSDIIISKNSLSFEYSNESYQALKEIIKKSELKGFTVKSIEQKENDKNYKIVIEVK